MPHKARENKVLWAYLRSKGIQPDPDKVSALKQMAQPTNSSER
jgi:hypothetical protein